MFGDIYLEPSHLVHIARNTAGADKVRIRVKFRKESRTPNGLDYTITDVPSQNYQLTITGTTTLVKYDRDSQMLTPTGSGTGENTITVKFTSTTDSASDITCKVIVHDVMNTWWMGNRSIDVPMDERVFHCQLSVLANFDADATTKVGKIG